MQLARQCFAEQYDFKLYFEKLEGVNFFFGNQRHSKVNATHSVISFTFKKMHLFTNSSTYPICWSSHNLLIIPNGRTSCCVLRKDLKQFQGDRSTSVSANTRAMQKTPPSSQGQQSLIIFLRNTIRECFPSLIPELQKLFLIIARIIVSISDI